MDLIPNLNLSLTFSIFIRILIACALSLPLAWDREKSGRSAGLRTFPLVSIAMCGYAIIGQEIEKMSVEGQAKIIEGLVAGIGFIGGGAILKNNKTVQGTATAASIWNTGAIGISVAYEIYEISILLTLINFIILRYSKPLKETNHFSDIKIDL